jgi:phage shock protein PspC (stress-responsive transcriptional regulator)
MDQQASTVPRHLRRRSDDKVIAGVCGGVADYLGVDPIIVRLAAIGLTLVGGAGVLAYVVAWLVLPADDGTAARIPLSDDTRRIAAIVLVTGFLLILFHDGGHWHNNEPLLPLALLGGGAYLLLRDRDGKQPSSPPAAPADPTVTAPSVATDELHPTDVQPAPAWTPPPWTPSASYDEPPEQPRPARPRSILGTLVLGVLLLVGGVIWMLDAADVVDTDPGNLLAGALIIIGLGLVVGAWYGRSRALIAAGVVLLVPLSTISMLDVPFTGGFGERTYRPALVRELPDAYRLIGGEMLVDLSELEWEGSQRVEASVAFGELVIVVPQGVRLEVDAEVGGGEVRGLERPTQSGLDIRQRYDITALEGAQVLELDLAVGFGEIVVRHG